MQTNQQVKVIGGNGQLSLGKEFAGKWVLIDQVDEGTWIIKAGEFVPDSEKWVHEPKHAKRLAKAIQWAEQHKPIDNFNKVLRQIEKKK